MYREKMDGRKEEEIKVVEREWKEGEGMNKGGSDFKCCRGKEGRKKLDVMYIVFCL